MTKVLITGASGFAGSHLAEHLVAQKTYEIFGTVFGTGTDIKGVIPLDHQLPLNLLDREEVQQALTTIQPEWIFHLAALSSPAQSFQDPRTTFTNNIEAQLNLLDAARALPTKPQVMVVGTAEEYGKVAAEDIPTNEHAPLKPLSPYAVSKITQDYLGLMYYQAYQLPIVRVRPFNHIGERQTEMFVLPAFAKQVAMIEAGKQEPIIRVGNLEAVRDFTDVKEMVGAYELALLKGKAGEVYNLGSGKGVSIRQLLEMLLSHSRQQIEVQVDPNRYIPADVPQLVADVQKFQTLTGWQATIPLEETVGRVLDYWREKI